MFLQEDKIETPSYGAGEIRIAGLTEKSLERLMASLRSGAYWVKAEDGKLISVPIWKELPSPIEDEEMLPFWRKENPQGEKKISYEEIILDPEERTSPSIMIKHLCGHYYTKDGYKQQAKNLESIGFECMRSKRGDDATYWETWYLPGLWASKGYLKEAIKDGEGEKEKLKLALQFLRKNVVFGQLDVTFQRLAMPNPE